MNIKLIVLLFLTVNINSLYDTIKYIETNNNPELIGDNGKAYGVVQIHQICIDEVNMIYGTDYTHEDAFDTICAREIFNLTLEAGRQKYIKKYKKEPTKEDLIRMWNGGIYNGYRKKQTKKYYKKYLKWEKQYLQI